MKKIIFASGLLALMVAATSCDKYDIYPEEFDGVFAIRDAGNREMTLYSTDDQAKVSFVVLKGGYDPEHASSATIKVMDDAEFADYQESSGNVSYVKIAKECYSFTAPHTDAYSVEFNFDNADERYKVADLYILPGELKNWLDNNQALVDGKTPVIPVKLVSDVDSVSAYNNMVVVMPKVEVPVLNIDVTGIVPRTVNSSTLTPGNSIYSPDGTYSIPCTNPWGFTLHVEASTQEVHDYNVANGSKYEPLTPDMYTLVEDYHFAPGTTSMPINLQIDLNKLQLFKTYAIAVKLADPAITWDSSNNPGSALNIADNVVIYTVRVFKAVHLEKIPLSIACVNAPDMETTEGSIDNLFDNNTSTYYHSAWSRTVDRSEPYASYLEITLPEAKTYFRFNVTTRDTQDARGHINWVRLFGTNDINNWPTEPFAEVQDMKQQLNGAAVTGVFGSDEEPFEAPEPYKYIRFSVYQMNNGTMLTQPSSGSVFWHASELELFGY